MAAVSGGEIVVSGTDESMLSKPAMSDRLRHRRCRLAESSGVEHGARGRFSAFV